MTQLMDAGDISVTIITTIVNAIKSFFTGIADTLVTAFNSMFVNAEGGLTNIAIWGLAFLALGFASTIMWALFRKI